MLILLRVDPPKITVMTNLVPLIAEGLLCAELSWIQPCDTGLLPKYIAAPLVVALFFPCRWSLVRCYYSFPSDTWSLF